MIKLDEEGKRNNLRDVKFLQEASCTSSVPIDTRVDGAKAYMEYAKSPDRRFLVCKLDDSKTGIRAVALVDPKDLPYLETKIREHRIARSSEILDKELVNVPEDLDATPKETRPNLVKTVAKMIVKFCEEERIDSVSFSEACKDPDWERMLYKMDTLITRWHVRLKSEGVPVGEYVKSGYRILSKAEKKNALTFVCDALEPDKTREHSPWVKTLAQKLIDFGEKEWLRPVAIAKRIVSPNPELTMKNFSKVVENWDKAKAMGMPTDTFESNGFSLCEGYEYEKDWMR